MTPIAFTYIPVVQSETYDLTAVEAGRCYMRWAFMYPDKPMTVKEGRADSGDIYQSEVPPKGGLIFKILLPSGQTCTACRMLSLISSLQSGTGWFSVLRRSSPNWELIILKINNHKSLLKSITEHFKQVIKIVMTMEKTKYTNANAFFPRCAALTGFLMGCIRIF